MKKLNSIPPVLKSLVVVTALFGLVASATAQQPAELVIQNGLVVTAVGRTETDLRIQNGVIAEMGRNLTAGAGARVIDARGMLVLPGGVDPHVHLTPTRTPTTAKGADDYTSASRAALAGGKTTISNFINLPATGTVDLRTTLNEATQLAKTQTIADVILHVTAGDPNQLSPTDVAMLYDRGFTLKIFMVRPAFDQNAAGFVKLIRAAGAAGLLTMLHCEDASIITTTQERMMAEGRGALKGQNFAESRPVVAEEIATQRAVGISEATGAPIYIVHISSERAMRVAEAAQARGLPVFTEVRFLYLHLTRERFDAPDGAIYTGQPPLREKSDANYLWSALAKGTVNVVDTDHVWVYARGQARSSARYRQLPACGKLSPDPTTVAVFGRRARRTHLAGANGRGVFDESGQAVWLVPAQGNHRGRIGWRCCDMGSEPETNRSG
jgi:dihydropyrimidinase